MRCDRTVVDTKEGIGSGEDEPERCAESGTALPRRRTDGDWCSGRKTGGSAGPDARPGGCAGRSDASAASIEPVFGAAGMSLSGWGEADTKTRGRYSKDSIRSFGSRNGTGEIG